MTGQRALVTGGAGFIGSHLVDALLSGGAAHVTVVDNFFLGREENLHAARAAHGAALDVHRADAADATVMSEICAAAQPDIVYNLATKALLHSFHDPADAARVNLDIAITLAELLRANAYRRLVHVSSSEVYGSAQQVPMDESHPLLAETTYAAGKAAADLLLASYVNMFGLDVVVARPFNNYGPRQNDAALAAIVPLTIRRVRRGESPVIQGDGNQTRDFGFVSDTVAAVLALAAADVPRGVPVNIGSGIEVSIREIVRRICALLGYDGEIRHEPPRAADVQRHCADITRLRAYVDPVPATPLEQGLERTVEWYASSEPAP